MILFSELIYRGYFIYWTSINFIFLCKPLLKFFVLLLDLKMIL